MLREYLIIAALMMAACLCALGEGRIVAEIGTRRYSERELRDGFKAYLDYQGLPENLSPADSIALWEQYWEELVAMYIYDAALQSGRITVSQEELEQEIRTNIPEGVKQIKDLHSKGEFDPQKYEHALKDRPAFQESVINLVRDMYSYRKLVDSIKAEVDIDADSVRAAWIMENSCADAQIIYFDYSQLRHIQAGEADILAYYNEHRDAYRRQDGRSYYFVRFEGITAKVSASAVHSENLKGQSAALHELAIRIGLQAAAAQLGYDVHETPMFSRGDSFIRMIGREPALIIYAFSNPVGSIPGIVYSPSGDFYVCEIARAADEYYIPLEIERPIIEIHASSQKRMQAMREYVASFMAKESPATYLAAAQRDSIRIVSQSGITLQSSYPPIGYVAQLNEAILSASTGQFTPLIEVSGLYYLALVREKTQPDPHQWHEAQDKVLTEARTKLRQEHLDEWYRAQRNSLKIIPLRP